MSIAIDLVVLALLVRAQIRPRRLAGFTLPLVLIVLGAAELGASLLGGTEPLKRFVKGSSRSMPSPTAGRPILASGERRHARVVGGFARRPPALRRGGGPGASTAA
ncbi:hypothetical protein [Actinoplanes sp. NPDC051411]|uniref:hypothetical protein n=1 Tax=Actinoplanes sp. NPDC051411 TaxID=3155522 RepID=UPI00342B56A0